MSDNLDIIRTLSHTLCDSDLKKAWRILYNEYELRGKDRANVLKITLKPGDLVEWPVRGGRTGTGRVRRVKTKKCLVAENKKGTGRVYDIPLSMLRLVSKKK
jgi:hypothetical protein